MTDARKSSKELFLLVIASAAFWGCSSSSEGNGSSGGRVGSGGTTNQGGSTSSVPGGSGGQSSAGGSASGGATASGGTTGRGGSSGSGGTQGVGGSQGSGGRPMGGSSGSTGGAPVSGGASGSSTGGSTVAGGRGGSAGATASGGRTGGGGTGAGTGGSAGAGGARATGGATATGGTTSTAGTSGSIVGATPPMGWNSWNTFGCNNLNEKLVQGVADTFVSSGMKDAGYQYVCLDDCWMSGRTSSGELQWDTSKFPGGMQALGEYIHGKGLKFGIYESPGATTCAGKTGSQGHETQDAQTFAKWGVDYLKYDLCSGQRSSFAKMGDALKATGRPIFYSINPVYGSGSCVPPNCEVDELKICNMWRIGFDINASWGSFTGLIDTDRPLAQYAGPGHWNDPDMLEVGRGMSADEDRSHFGMWAILAAPLIAGNDIRSMSTTTKAILTNPDVIAVNQDPLGKQGTRVATPSSNLEVWSKQMSGTNVRAVALFNRSGSAASITVKWSDIGLPAGAATVRDLYAQKDLGNSTDSYTATSVPSHGIVMLKVTSAQ
jgi:alpha-galactosidase